MNIKAIVFDVDGVVLTTHDAKGRYFWSETAKEDLGLSKAHFQKIFSYHWDDVVKGRIETISYLQNVFKDPIFKELDMTPEVYLNYWLTKHNNIDDHVNLEIIELIRFLKVPCYLGTNQEYHRTDRIKRCVGKTFQHIFASYQMGSIKPEASFFHYIEKDLGLRSEEILLVDDTLENIEGAQNCKWNTFHYRGDIEDLKALLKSEEGVLVEQKRKEK